MSYHPGFTQAPQVTSVLPKLGALPGGTLLTIQGSGFQSGETVLIGGQACLQPTYVSSTQLTCVTPGHVAGAVDVQVKNPDGQLGTLAQAFQYFGAPNPIAGFDHAVGGGIMTGPGVRLRFTAGSVGNPAHTQNTGVASKLGLQGVLPPPR